MNPWDKAAQKTLLRPDTLHALNLWPPLIHSSRVAPMLSRDMPKCVLERGVNYFVLALEALGATTLWSCEGHPTGFYIMFHADYRTALNIARAGYFNVELDSRMNCFALRLYERMSKSGKFTDRTRCNRLRAAALAWERIFKTEVA
jgi:hypothetical protein